MDGDAHWVMNEHNLMSDKEIYRKLNIDILLGSPAMYTITLVSFVYKTHYN